jgi:transposase
MRNGKRVFSLAFKKWLVQQATQPGVSVAALALHHQVNANQLRRWMRLPHLGSDTAAAAQALVLPVRLASPTIPAANTEGPSATIEIALAGATVRVPEGAGLAHLRLVLAALRG